MNVGATTTPATSLVGLLFALMEKQWRCAAQAASCRAAYAACHDAVATEDGPRLEVEVEGIGSPICRVDITGRATSVPFTVVTTGRERTTTVN